MIGTKLGGRYEIVREIGRGGMGVVYLARDPLLDRDVALKVMSEQELGPDAFARFQREARVIARMDHPAIVGIHDLGEHAGKLFLVMPVIAGTDFRHLMKGDELTLGDALDVVAQVAGALAYSHSCGVVHRDIKPENILVTREAGRIRARVTDFGLAVASNEQRLTAAGVLVGTVSYLAPEQISAGTFDGRTDIYALGVILYECVVGDPPFGGDLASALYRIVHELPPAPRSLGAKIPQAIDDLIMRCLSKDASRRPESATEIAMVISECRAAATAASDDRLTSIRSMTIQLPKAPGSAMVGRDEDFAELQRRFQAAASGEAQLVLVAGEPGIGKTRLLDEMAMLMSAKKVAVLRGRFMELDSAFAYQGFCEIVQDHLRTPANTSMATPRGDLSDLASDLVALFPALAENESMAQGRSLITRPAESRLHERSEIFELLARTLIRISHGAPLVLLLDDLHGADVSVEALQYIVRRVSSMPILFVASYTPGLIDKTHPISRLTATLRGDARFAHITLAPLTEEQLRGYLRLTMGSDRFDVSFVRKIYEATEGNPYFTRELVRSLIDAGVVVHDSSGAWTLRTDLFSAEAMPATIRQAVEKRIERLPERGREILASASVIGRQFEFRDLEQIVDSGNVDDDVEKLIASGLIEEDRAVRGDRLAFTSGVVRDVLYGALPRRRRRTLHRRYAELLESRHARKLDRVYAQLLHHYAQADDPSKIAEYGLLTARQALQAHSVDDAIRAIRLLLEFVEDVHVEAVEGEARELMARAFRADGNLEEALAQYERAVRIAESDGTQTRLLELLLQAAETAWQARKVEETLRWTHRGLDLARAAKEPKKLADFLSLRATLANLRGEQQLARSLFDELDRLSPREGAAAAPPRGGTILVGLTSHVEARHPAEIRTNDEVEVFANVFEPLITNDLHGNLAPMLAESWTMRDDAKSVTFNLRRGALFHNGTAVDAATVRRALEASVRHAAAQLPAAFAPIDGVADFLAGREESLRGLRIVGALSIAIDLVEPLPIYLAFVTDSRAAIALDGAGTGPFRFESIDRSRVVLAASATHWSGKQPHVDAVEFRCGLSSVEIAEQLRAGTLDLGRDLLPRDAEEILSDRRGRFGIVEAAKKTTYFVLFNAERPLARRKAVPQALCATIREGDLIRRTLGRFAQPADGLIPPGILGHEAGRRLRVPTNPKILEMIRLLSVQLKAGVHPIYQDRFGALTKALLDSWHQAGVEATIVTRGIDDYIRCVAESDDIDFILARWNADYADPDDFTYGLFHSRHGRLRRYFSSPELDDLLEAARAERDRKLREDLYRRIEALLLESGLLFPLFHEIDYRVIAPSLRGVTLDNVAPFVNYCEIAKAADVVPGGEVRGGTVQIPLTGIVPTLDPGQVVYIVEAEVVPTVFETLTREAAGARIVPWLASSITAERDGRRYRIELRDDVRFHDGRRLTTRDVRYSFERLLRDPESRVRYLLAAIRGARALIEGTATELEGLRILSTRELVIELEHPMAFFPALLANTGASIVPEGLTDFTGTWREGCVGTGAFRVARVDPGRRLELEANPFYWRPGYPRTEGLAFHYGIAPDEILEGFRDGRFSIAWELSPNGVDELRLDTRVAATYYDTPRLSTYYVVFNIHRIPDEGLRRLLMRSIDTEELVRRHARRVAIPARTLTPPSLLGYDPPRRSGSQPRIAQSQQQGSVDAVMLPVYRTQYGSLTDEILESWRVAGVTVEVLGDTIDASRQHIVDGTAGMTFNRWTADYPDPDTFAHDLLHTKEGLLGKFCGTPELDALIDRAREENDPSQRHTLYREIEEYAAAHALLLPLFHEQTYCFARPELQDFELTLASPVVAYDRVWIRRT